jgi:signal transduction histidine kinase/CheY-like chemotaxis protein
VFPAHVTDSPVLDERGNLVGIVGISTDITERKQAEAEARQKDTLIRIAGRLTHTGGWAIDLPDRVFWSDELFDILEVPRGRMPPLADALALYPEPWRDKIVSAIQASRQDGTAFDLEVEILTAQGARRWVRVRGEADRQADGSITRVQGAFQDITEHRHLEQQYLRAQRMESIGTLASGIAHDLNNVLAPILWSIGLLQDDERDAGRLETLSTLEASAKRGAAMVGRLLSFARGADGRREEVAVPPLVRDLATIVRDTFPKNIGFEDRVSPDLWALQADATQLHQVLLNLCVNARDAMPDGGQITLTATNVFIDHAYAALNIDAGSGPYVSIAVADTGAGIPKEIIDKIFDPFFTTKEIGKGTGLGLATSLAIVTGHKGFIRVHSTPGAGTRFQVYLPARTIRAGRASPAPAVIHPRGQGETVLVVDDEAGIRQIAKRTLEAFGYRVLLAGDGAEAIAVYKHHQADIAVVVTDMMMPLMDGAATIRELVRLNPEVRIIAASGLATDAQAAGAAAARVTYFLPKPYTAETLLAAISSALPLSNGA